MQALCRLYEALLRLFLLQVSDVHTEWLVQGNGVRGEGGEMLVCT
jgi:hypothetical protein